MSTEPSIIATDHALDYSLGSIGSPAPTVRDVPPLVALGAREVQRKQRSRQGQGKHRLRYRSKRHASMPHVVKFSGGRSSAMLLFVLLENGLLDRDRGDVIVFNNTSAEHPATYRFVRDCMVAARRYGIPFYQIEFQTYEDARRGEWTRLPTYRLVNDMPKSDANPDGFHWHGEVFEELLSWTGYVPNQFNRICTRHLKLDVTRAFLKDWLAAKPGIPRLGHYGDKARMDDDTAYQRHVDRQGGVPRDIFLRKREYVWQRPHFRPEQRYGDFSPGWQSFENTALKGKTLGDQAVFGRRGVEYVAFIGLREDEPHRVQRVRDRNDTTKGYEGEHVYMPLADMSVTRDDVNDFWDRQAWDLSLPKDASLSNCVYCFLKGAVNLRDIHTYMAKEVETGITDEFGPLGETPSDLEWWHRLETTYGRDLKAEGRSTRTDVTHIGFFGNNRFSYGDVGNGTELGGLAESILPCDCTE